MNTVYAFKKDDGDLTIYKNKEKACYELIKHYYTNYLAPALEDTRKVIVTARDREDVVERTFLLNQLVDSLKIIDEDFINFMDKDFIEAVGEVDTYNVN